jgi:hypothetical protein
MYILDIYSIGGFYGRVVQVYWISMGWRKRREELGEASSLKA